MGTLTQDLPKPMLPVAGKPLLEHILDRLKEAGIERVALVVGYRREVIQEHFAGYPLPIDYRIQEKIEGTAAAVSLARDFAGNDRCLITFGDIVCEPSDYRGILDAARGVSAALGARSVDDPWQGAAIYERDGIVNRIIEKPPKGTSTTHWNSAGLYVFEPVAFDYIARVRMSPRGEYEITTAIEDMLADGHRLRLYEVKGGWRDVGRPEDLPVAEDLLDVEG